MTIVGIRSLGVRNQFTGSSWRGRCTWRQYQACSICSGRRINCDLICPSSNSGIETLELFVSASRLKPPDCIQGDGRHIYNHCYPKFSAGCCLSSTVGTRLALSGQLLSLWWLLAYWRRVRCCRSSCSIPLSSHLASGNPNMFRKTFTVPGPNPA